MNEVLVIHSNWARGSSFSDASFMGRLHEDCVWDLDAYLKFESALLTLNQRLHESKEIARDIAFCVLDIFSEVMLYYGCHFDANDGYEIANLSDEEVRNCIIRFRLVTQSFFAGEIIDSESLPLTKGL